MCSQTRGVTASNGAGEHLCVSVCYHVVCAREYFHVNVAELRRECSFRRLPHVLDGNTVDTTRLPPRRVIDWVSTGEGTTNSGASCGSGTLLERVNRHKYSAGNVRRGSNGMRPWVEGTNSVWGIHETNAAAQIVVLALPPLREGSSRDLEGGRSLSCVP